MYIARKLERERDAAQEKLSTVYQWIERHHQDGFTDSMTYWQNLEKIGDKYSDKIDDAERQRDAARKDAEKLAQALNKLMQCADQNINNCSDAELLEAARHGFAPEIIEQAKAFLASRQALAAHEAIKPQD